MNVGVNTVSDLPDDALAVGCLQRFLRIGERPAIVYRSRVCATR